MDMLMRVLLKLWDSWTWSWWVVSFHRFKKNHKPLDFFAFVTSPPESHDESSPMQPLILHINWLQILTAATWWLWSCCCYWRTFRWSPSFFPPFLCKLLCSYEHQEILLNICSHSMKSCTFWKMNNQGEVLDKVWKFEELLSHSGPLKPKLKDLCLIYR